MEISLQSRQPDAPIGRVSSCLAESHRRRVHEGYPKSPGRQVDGVTTVSPGDVDGLPALR